MCKIENCICSQLSLRMSEEKFVEKRKNHEAVL